MRLMKFKLNRDFVLVTKEGPSFRFVKGQVTNVPPRYAADVLAIGGEPIEGEDANLAAEVRAEIEREKASDAERLERLRAAIGRLVERNQSGDFTAGGKPNKKKVEALIGGPVSDEEIAVVFEQVKNADAA